MRNCLGSFFLALTFCFLPIRAQEYSGSGECHLTVTPMFTFSYPIFDFNENYQYNWGTGAKIGFNTDMGGLAGLNFDLSWYMDRFKIRDTEYKGTMNNIGIAWDIYILYLKSGMGWSVGWFDLNDSMYRRFSGTGMELENESREAKFSFDRYFGLRVPIGEYMALDCSYHLISIEKEWMFWHSTLSGSIKEITIMPFDAIADKLLESHRPAGAVLMKLVGAGISWVWYYYDYEHHNWPWHDVKPVRYVRGSIGVSFLIGGHD